jgi:hypothetical protein
VAEKAINANVMGVPKMEKTDISSKEKRNVNV